MYGNLDTPELRELARKAGPYDMTPFRVLVIGPQGSGKSTFAAHLGAALGFTVAETSDFLMRQYAAFKVNDIPYTPAGEGYEEWLKIVREKTQEVRRALVAFGDTMTALKPDCLVAGAAAEGQVIVGARRKIELEAWFLNGRNDQDVIVEIIHDTSPDDAYELANWKRERRASSGRVYQTAKAEYAEWAPIAAHVAQMVLQDKQEQADAAAR